jgi:hypothetical protein
MISLPVSIGEALDKLTILDIKVDKIKDPERNKHCKVEHDILYEQLKDIVAENQFYYDKLKDINESIWEMQDEVRASSDDIGQKCIDILNMNDSRFRIKDILNRKAQSTIQEQKGYPLKKVLVVPHPGLGDHVNIIGAVRYLSTIYDEVHLGVFSLRARLENVKSFYADNSAIKIINIATDHDLKEKWKSELSIKGYTSSHLLGSFSQDFNGDWDIFNNTVPDIWYTQLNIDKSIRNTYFYVPDTVENMKMYELIKDIPYIFCHRKSSGGFNSGLISWNTHSILTIDPDINVYVEGDRWYNIAQEFINKPFWYYYETMRHATELHLVDSSFFCMAIHLSLDAKIRKIYNVSSSLSNAINDAWPTS